MKLTVYTFFNNAAEAFNNPQFDSRPIEAIKVETIRAVKAKKVNPSIFDCELVYLGTFEDETGSFELLKSPQLIQDFSVFKPKETENEKV